MAALASMNYFVDTAATGANGSSYSKFLTQSPLTAANGFISREERVAAFGVDCHDDITWRVWAVGGEYERRFLIKNTHDRRQIISYRLPKQKATFFVDFPEPATISSGMSYTLVVRFRPLELVEHHDELEVTVKGRGSFKIRLDAYTPYAHLTAPQKHDFNMCPVNVSTPHTFPIRNTGTIPLQFQWEIPAPFSVSPVRGALLEGQSMDVTVSFTPEAACACVGQAICRLVETGETIAVVNFSGIGKFAFLRIKDLFDGNNIVDFGDVLTSSAEVRHLTLVNPSFVDTAFDLQLTNPDITSAFTISPMSGVVPRGGETQLAVRFTPKNSGAHYNSDFTVRSVSCATAASFRCSGSALAPRVYLSATNVNFGDVDIEQFYKDPAGGVVGGGAAVFVSTRGKTTGATTSSSSSGAAGGGAAKPATVEKWITVNNDSELPIRFHFAGCDPGCAFTVSPPNGQLRPKSSTNVKVSFCPTSPINHLRRLFVMTSGAENALILDVFGSAYTSKIRPAPFDNRSVQLFFSKLEFGLGGMTPEEAERLIAAMRRAEDGHDDDDGISEHQLSAQAALTAAMEDASRPKRRRAGFATVFPNSVGQHTFPFTIDTSQLTVRHETVGQAQSVVVRNHTGSKATAFWSVPSSSSGNGGEANFWSVEPETQDVPANGTATFRVICAPNAPPQTFGSFLECYVNYKTMRSFRLVSEEVFTPPHCLLLQCTHLAPYREHGPVPAVRFASAVCFQPCREQRSVYQVLEITNDGDTAIGFDLQLESSMVPDANNSEEYFSSGPAAVDENGDAIVGADPEAELLAAKRRQLLAGVFQVYPSTGTLPARSTSMVLLKFSPPLASKFFGAVHVSYNGAPTVSGNVLLKGEGFVPRVALECDGVLAFRPTTVGGATTRQYTVTNLSRIPLAFRATVPDAFADIVSLSPTGAVLKGSERLKVTATFTPNAVRAYEFAFPVEVSVPTELDSPLSTTALGAMKMASIAAAAAAASSKKNSTVALSPAAVSSSAANAALGLPLLPALADNVNGYGRVVAASGAVVDTGDLSATCFTPTVPPPDVVTTQQCTVKAEGHAAFLSLEPLSKDLGDVGVGGPVSFPLTLYNTGLSDVAFEVRYKLVACDGDADVEADAAGGSGSGPSAAAAPIDPFAAIGCGTVPSPAAPPISPTAAAHRDPNASALLEAADAGGSSLMSFGPAATGVIRARAHHTVSVSTKLALRGKHTLLVYVVSGGDLSLLSAIRAPTLSSANGDEAAAAAAEEAFLARLPQCRVTANGQNACLQIADARCVYQQKSQLWRQMGIGKINAVLAAEVDKKDLKLRALSFEDTLAALSAGAAGGNNNGSRPATTSSTSAASPASGSPPSGAVACNLGVDAFHAAPIRVHTVLTNNSITPVEFRFRFPIDNEIPKEPWHADHRGLNDPIANVVDRGLFDVSPRAGTVPPRGQTVVTFTYFHSEVGTHTLPVILRVEDGKQVLLQLSATTIEPGARFLQFHHDTEYHELVPVAIGDLEPPIQYTEVQNLSASSVNYAIDETALSQLKEANYDFPILQCLNPRGVIPPMSSLLLSWFFRPLEAKSYSATINVSVEGGDTYRVTLGGRGYHPKLLAKRELRTIYETMFAMPRVPVLEHPSMPIRLSADSLSLGPVPFHSYHRRHVALTNSHPEDTFLFEWRSVLQHGDQIFEIEPPRGAIEPGVTVHFCVSMYSGSFSHIIDTPVHCHVMNESLRQRRQVRIAEREEQRRLEMDQKPETAAAEFGGGGGLNGTNRSARSAADALTGRGLRPRQRHAITTVPPRFQSTARLQKTIQKLEETALAEDVDENAEEWAHIEVTPTVIELLIQTRIMPLDHFTDAYGEDAARAFFFPTMLGNMHPMRPGYFLGGKGGANNGNSTNADIAVIDGDESPTPAHHQYAAASALAQHYARPESVISDASLSVVLQRRADRVGGSGPSSRMGGGAPLPPADVTPFERDIATGCIKEILRRVVQSSLIADAMLDPSEDPTPYFCEMIATTAGGDAHRSPPLQSADGTSAFAAAAAAAAANGGAFPSAPTPSAIAPFVVDEEDLADSEFASSSSGSDDDGSDGSEYYTDDEDEEEEASDNGAAYRASTAQEKSARGGEADFANAEDDAEGSGLARDPADKATPVPSYADEIPRRKVSIAPSAYTAHEASANGGRMTAGSLAAGPTPTPLNPSAIRGDSSLLNGSDAQPSHAPPHPQQPPKADQQQQEKRKKKKKKKSKGASEDAKKKKEDKKRGASVSGAAAATPLMPQRIRRSAMPVPGDVQCVAEEVIGDVLFYLMSQALTREGVISQACAAATKQRRASEARMHDHATSASLMLGYGGSK